MDVACFGFKPDCQMLCIQPWLELLNRETKQLIRWRGYVLIIHVVDMRSCDEMCYGLGPEPRMQWKSPSFCNFIGFNSCVATCVY